MDKKFQFNEVEVRAALADALARHSVGDSRLQREILDAASYNLLSKRTRPEVPSNEME
jgi:hypothetical protein